MVKRIFGALACVFGAVVLLGFVVSLTSKPPATGNSPYASGQRAGRMTAPFLGMTFIIVGARMAMSSDAAPKKRKSGKKKKKRPLPIEDD